MSTHTVVNLLEVEDQAPKFGMPEGLQSRFARQDLELETLGLAHFKLAPGEGPPFGHRHPGGPEADEVYVVVSGSARIKIGDDVIDLAQWDAVRVPGDEWRALKGGADGAEVLAFGGRSAESEMDQGFWA
jgi:mannose-6-phosphate isomerase-like protein (cupin superfamily)